MTHSAPSPQPDRLDLSGEWRLSLGGSAPPEPGEPLPPIHFEDTITLPTSTETSGKGPANPEGRTAGLTPVRRFVGAAWYERDFVLPAEWTGLGVRLHLERTKYASVWIDGRPLGAQSQLCTPHDHDLGPLPPGPHRLTLCVDNRLQPAPGDNHQVSEHTQGNWNGVLGRIELRVQPPARIEQVTSVPEVAGRAFALRIRLAGTAGPAAAGALTITAESRNHAGPPHRPPVVSVPCVPDAAGWMHLTLPLGPDAQLWDEFSPALYRITLRLTTTTATNDTTFVTGLREFTAPGTQFAVNGRTTFLRGEVNCCVFPLTGHPPMDVEGWLQYYRTLQAYGINHVRFHSWTPPDAAFAAADELGIYVQTELPFWGEWNDDIRHALLPEAEAILRTYGHHPSFVLLTLGNEHRGERAPMTALVAALRAIDPHRLYAEGANNFLTAPSLAPADDCWITARVPDPARPGRFANVRGCHATPDGADGHLQIGPGGTRADYSAAIAGIRIPVVSHEIGQFSVLPHFSEITRYTGVFAARNLEHFRAKAAAAGLLNQADASFAASARLAALLYREEIEAALRTPGFGGFQLLGLQDFPGQGTALVGLLDAFMQSKGAITPEEFRRFCAPHVLLARFDRHTWTGGETFSADLDLAHYGPSNLAAGTVEWELRPVPSTVGACLQANPGEDRMQAGSCGENQSPIGKLGQEPSITTGAITTSSVTAGGLRRLGELRIPLPSLATAQALELHLTLTTTSAAITAAYPLWVYPAALASRLSTLSHRPSTAAGLTVARSFDVSAQAALAAGGRVLLMPDAAHPFAHTPGGGFMTDFWCWPMFHSTPGTMGLLVESGHPALAGFPTAPHSDWQWYHLAQAAQPVVLDALPHALRPIVQVIDNLERCHRLGLLFEAQVGPGRLLVCALDLPSLAEKHPEARQLLASLLAYAGSEAFTPMALIDQVSLIAAIEAKGPPRFL